MKTRLLGNNGPAVSALGLGCMGMSFGYGGSNEAESEKVLQEAADLGVSFFDTAEVYGPYTNEALLGRALRKVRDKVIIATKFGFDISEHGQGVERMVGVTSQPDHIRVSVEGSLKRLGIETIDVLYQHRVDPSVPIEDVVGVMSDLVKEGKVRWLGLSEASANTLRRAHAVHPISALQSEYSLWSRDVEKEILPACKELGIAFVPYSPIGRGFLTGQMTTTDGLSADDYRRTLPRFQQVEMQKNMLLLDVIKKIAAECEATPAQVALTWLLAQSNNIIPIPGARKIAHIKDNMAAADVSLTADQIALLSATFTPDAVSGERYTQTELNMVNL